MTNELSKLISLIYELYFLYAIIFVIENHYDLESETILNDCESWVVTALMTHGRVNFMK